MRSWARCLDDYGLDPANQRGVDTITPAELEERQSRLGDLLEISKVEMNNLYQQVASTGYAILLTDPEGVILHQVSDPNLTQEVKERGLRPGAIWTESAEGTNGIGTCLVEKKPVVIHRDEHFFARNSELTCSAAPIFNPQGELWAVLDISGCSKLAQQHSRVLVHMGAQMIENRAFLTSFPNHFLVRFHSRPEFVSTLGEGVLAFDEQGLCVAANPSGTFQLGYESSNDLVGKKVGEIFNTSLEDLVDRASRSFFQVLPLHEPLHNRRFFAVVQAPEGFLKSQSAARPKSTSGKAVAPDPVEEDGDLAAPEFGDPQMVRNLALLRKVADRGIPILLGGETGTGKGVLAEYFHQFGKRSDQPFVTVCCAAIPETLIESELFGYKPGAFTGASKEGRQGKVAQANGGTLFLDEIGDMPLNLQVRLLRVLEEREVVPLGSERPITVDIQVVSATHQNLEELVAQGQFREDLYYRLKGLEIRLPSLRERCDKRRLIQRLVAKENPDGDPVEIDEEVMEVLKNHRWPGNIRQLRNVLRSMLALRESSRLTIDELPPGFLEESPAPSGDVEYTNEDDHCGVLKRAEGEALFQILEENQWNISVTAQKLGCSRNTLYRKMRRLDIRRPSG
ncbi:sigma-54-dependent Fis family transcriptional regulator [Thiohalorhabdus sp. Cl-TMA]|uniref:Sigma-54-dependent Fis family transcriptional regulator n=1 Tax=Thiohalorhabdus methylotrophus TaxID=3242694 RepID=A0ABV4TUS4_9GAMM